MTLAWTIRPEAPADYAQIRAFTIKAFAEAYGDTGLVEANLIEQIRELDGYDAALALVAAAGDLVVGQVMLSSVRIVGEREQEWPALVVAPLGVRIGWQRQGIGSALMRRVLANAQAAGHERVVLSGSEKYYPRFGFINATALGLVDSLGTTSPHWMALGLAPDAWNGVVGRVEYNAAFKEIGKP